MSHLLLILVQKILPEDEKSSSNENDNHKQSDDKKQLIANMELLCLIFLGCFLIILAIYCCSKYRADYLKENRKRAIAHAKKEGRFKRSGSTTINTDPDSFNTDEVNSKIEKILQNEKRLQKVNKKKMQFKRNDPTKRLQAQKKSEGLILRKYEDILEGDSWKKNVRGADSNQLTNSISHDIDPRERKATIRQQRRKESLDFESLKEKIAFRKKMEQDDSYRKSNLKMTLMRSVILPAEQEAPYNGSYNVEDDYLNFNEDQEELDRGFQQNFFLQSKQIEQLPQKFIKTEKKNRRRIYSSDHPQVLSMKSNEEVVGNFTLNMNAH